MATETRQDFRATYEYAMVVMPPAETDAPGKKYYKARGWCIWFEVDANYIPDMIVGEGSCGSVCSSWNTDTREMVAVKKIHNVFNSEEDAMSTLREIKILTLIDHPNVLTLKDVMVPPSKTDFNELYLVTDLVYFTLRDMIMWSRWPCFASKCRILLFQLLLGVRHLHSANVLHRDLKPENVLVSRDLSLRIGDFGSARTCTSDGKGMEDCIGTQWYLAPELLLHCEYGPPADMWAVGCIFAELLGKEPLFPGRHEVNQLLLIFDLLGTPQEDDLDFITDLFTRMSFDYVADSVPMFYLHEEYSWADPLALDLLEKMLKFDPRKRVTATEALQHPYFYGLFDPEKHPLAETKLDFEADEKGIDMETVREHIWKSVVHFHPEKEEEKKEKEKKEEKEEEIEEEKKEKDVEKNCAVADA